MMSVVNMQKALMEAAKKAVEQASWHSTFCDTIESMYPRRSLEFKMKVLEICEDLFFWSKDK